MGHDKPNGVGQGEVVVPISARGAAAGGGRSRRQWREAGWKRRNYRQGGTSRGRSWRGGKGHKNQRRRRVGGATTNGWRESQPPARRRGSWSPHGDLAPTTTANAEDRGDEHA
jgi:hypothetical protein